MKRVCAIQRWILCAYRRLGFQIALKRFHYPDIPAWAASIELWGPNADTVVLLCLLGPTSRISLKWNILMARSACGVFYTLISVHFSSAIGTDHLTKTAIRLVFCKLRSSVFAVSALVSSCWEISIYTTNVGCDILAKTHLLVRDCGKSAGIWV